MALVASTGFLDFTQFDLSGTLSLSVLDFRNDEYDVKDTAGIPGLPATMTFEDGLYIYDAPSLDEAPYGYGYFGHDMAFDPITMSPTAGTVELALFFDVSNPFAVEFFVMANLDISLVSLFSVAESIGSADDLALFKQTLSGDDQIYGSAFDDVVLGYQGDDLFNGYSGNDLFLGSSGRDTASGGKDDDRLFGGVGSDRLNGNSGNDVLKGGNGSDTLVGGQGTDLMFGGADSASDVFIFFDINNSTADQNRDRIFDFVSGVDKIKLAGIDADIQTAGDQAFIFGDHSVVANGIWTTAFNGNLTVWADVTGDNTADFSVRLMGVATVVATDFIL